MKRLGIAISVYNKFDEVCTNINVIRNHWKAKDIHISVCCNDPETFERYRDTDIDNLVIGVDYRPFEFIDKGWKRMRQHDTIKKSILGCVDHCEYVIQMHGDAFALDDSVVFEMIDHMAKNDIKLAYRGRPVTNSPKTPYGHIDDHFMILDCDYVKQVGFFSNVMTDMMIKQKCHVWCSEGILGYLAHTFLNDDQIWHYDDMRHNIVHEKYYPAESGHVIDSYFEDGIGHSVIPPFNFDPNRKFLHSDKWEYTERFFKETGVPVSLISRTNEADV